MGTSDTTITANWTLYPTLTVALNGGTTTQTFSSSYPAGTTISLITPTRSDYTFIDWSVSGTSASVSGTTLTMGTTATTITANWLTDFTSATYTYTDSPKTFTVPGNGSYKIELWGTRVGSTGGKGAYTSGEIELNEGDILYIYIGSTST